MQRVQANPLAVVAAATAGGMLVGRMMRRRGHRRDEGYLRGTASHGFQGYESARSYQQPSVQPYQGGAGYQQQTGYQGYEGFPQGPQYRAEQEFQQDSRSHGSHENFSGGSNRS